jgi:UDP-N-acetyl-D-glucosamine/UDP-N-acetyl-D-galactosamine dehydrogenase
MRLDEMDIGVIGLGYVGLPLAVEFGKFRNVVGFDTNSIRINALRDGHDSTLEVSAEQLRAAKDLSFSDDVSDIKGCTVYIVTVPTPIDDNNCPDLSPLQKASAMIGEILQEGNIVIYESTVYPGATEEVCVPILEKHSGLQFNKGFYVGYSPERINPGDKINTLTSIKKITSGSTKEVAHLVDKLYGTIITAGTHLAQTIKTAEAAKVIENTQRDLNIAVINEFAKIFNILGIDTQDVLDAASTKWNFLRFKPGLVGGHCISVDPYYLTFKAKEVGYQPEVILAGRRINDTMGSYVATQLVKAISRKKIHIDEANVLILGFTFKGDCPDVRNTKIVDVVEELISFNVQVDVFDQWADPDEVLREYGIKLSTELIDDSYDAIVIAVDHSDYKAWGEEKIRKLGKLNHVLYDVKNVLRKTGSDLRL